MKVWDWARIELATPGSVVRLTFVARHVTNCATWPSLIQISQDGLLYEGTGLPGLMQY